MKYTKKELTDKVNSLITDNNNKEITAQRTREILVDIIDSMGDDDTLPIADITLGISSPLSDISFMHGMNKYASHVVKNPNDYFDLAFFDLYGEEDSFLNEYFVNVSEFVNFLSNNFNNNGTVLLESVRVKMYLLQDNSIKPIKLIHGYNIIESMLRLSLKETNQYFIDNFNWDGLADFLRDLVNSFGIDNSFIGNDVTVGDANKVFWISNMWQRRFSLPADYATMSAGSVLNRKVLDNNNNVVSLPDSYRDYSFNNYKVCIMNATNPYEYYFFDKHSTVVQDYLKNPKYVAGIFYRVTDTENNDNFAIFFKPIGIDILTIPFFDYTKFDLIVRMSAQDRKPYYKKIDITQSTGSNNFSMSWRINKNSNRVRLVKKEWFFKQIYNKKYTNSRTHNFIPKIDLLFRDKITKRVSKVSASSLKFINKTAGIGYKIDNLY